MKRPLEVMWLPTPPESGGYSMDRYWRELDRVKNSVNRGEFAFSSLLKGPPESTRQAGRWVRAAARYLAYPLRAVMAKPVAVFHLLDHSHAHVLRFLEGKGKKIVTVHDLVPVRDSTGLTASQVKRFRDKLHELRRADLILVDSNSTGADLKNFLGVNCPPCERLLLGINNQAFSEEQRMPMSELENLAPGPIVLCVGSNQRRKNLAILPDVFKLALVHLDRLTFIRVGPRLEASIRSRLKAYEPRLQIVELSNLSEAKLISIYQRADVLFFPSILEGDFGFPTVEAMAAGTPVVASNTTRIPDMDGEAALYFEPTDPAKAAEHLVRVLHDQQLAEELRKKGRKQALQLDWKCHFEQLCNYYRALAAT
jgi:glycosyltransferase involved in cell wall biosynthesis